MLAGLVRDVMTSFHKNSALPGVSLRLKGLRVYGVKPQL